MFYEEESNELGDLDEEVQLLNKAWQTEVNCPEILPFKKDLIESMTQRIQDQQAIIEERVATPDEIFTASLYQMDIDRVRYSLARYLRARVLKIQQSTDYIMSKMEALDRLSAQEKTFATKLYNLNNTYMEEAYFNRLPEGLKEHIEQENDRLVHAQPSMKDFVFCMANIALENVQHGTEVASYQANDVFVASYNDISDYVADNSVDLI